MPRVFSIIHSMRFRFTTGALAALALSMSILAVILVRQTERDTLANSRQSELAQTVRVAEVLAHRVAELQRALRVTAAEFEPATSNDHARLAAFLRSQPVLNAMFSSVFVVDEGGRMVALEQGTQLSFPDTDLKDRAYIRETLSRGVPVVSSIILSRVNGRPLINFTYPLIRAGHSVGLIAASLRLESRELIADLVDDDDSGTMAIVTDLHGQILAHPDSQVLLGSMASQPRFSEAFKAWVAAGSIPELRGLTLPQSDDMVTASGVAGTDWVIWRAVPKADLLRPLQSARRRTLIWLAALLAPTSLITFILLGWALRPLRQLSERAQHLFDGTRAPHEGWPRASGELGHLTLVLRQAVQDRTQYQALNEETLKRLSSVMGAAPIGIAFTRNHHFELVSQQLCHLLGRTESSLLGRHVSLLYPNPDDCGRVGEMLEAALARGERYEGEWRMVRGDGTTFHAQLRGCAMDGTNREAGLIWTFNDVTTQVAIREKLKWSATHDALTGLANRTLLYEQLHSVFGQAGEGPGGVLIAIDLDHFKPVNDAGGHAAGDEMLRLVAAAIAGSSRAEDLIARTGGDEFAIVAYGGTQQVGIRIAETVKAAISAISLNVGGRTLRVGACLGVAVLSRETPSVEAWIAEADRRCYEAKRSGRNRVWSDEAAGDGLIVPMS